jgi:hypothetical protein
MSQVWTVVRGSRNHSRPDASAALREGLRSSCGQQKHPRLVGPFTMGTSPPRLFPRPFEMPNFHHG